MTITNNTTTMGIEELILQRAKQEGKVEGKAEGKAEVVRNLIIKMGLTNEQTAEIAGVGIKFVQQLREEVTGRKA
jgi:predicted transposase YdaD